MIKAEQVLSLLSDCRGSANGIRMSDLCELLCGRQNPGLQREVRELITVLREQGWPICSHPSVGYFWANSPEDLEQTIEFLRGRAMTSLRQISRLRRVALPLLSGQQELSLGQEPLTPDFDPDRYNREPKVTSVVNIAPNLLSDPANFLEKNPTYDQNRAIAEALETFLELFNDG
ncbi:hypothetical protein GS597_01335 [Synechococcales cyanobacterium C]|uniref:Uncharacterized protein n=1 Tax=Petrachloros mirabilis ULC683 TaxID=2781853 RepID=A0A8K1ZWY3_9CYAN|nr:hypothetical protein [Petrachloros mirabilis]NCJ05182.1 hypothetical protein [Petrachloros mirabilis ULC683]